MISSAVAQAERAKERGGGEAHRVRDERFAVPVGADDFLKREVLVLVGRDRQAVQGARDYGGGHFHARSVYGL